MWECEKGLIRGPASGRRCDPRLRRGRIRDKDTALCGAVDVAGIREVQPILQYLLPTPWGWHWGGICVECKQPRPTSVGRQVDGGQGQGSYYLYIIMRGYAAPAAGGASRGPRCSAGASLPAPLGGGARARVGSEHGRRCREGRAGQGRALVAAGAVGEWDGYCGKHGRAGMVDARVASQMQSARVQVATGDKMQSPSLQYAPACRLHA
jgi:hypothetical protein